MSLENVLANIPGYGGYLAKQQYDQQRQMGQLQQLGGLQSLMAQFQQQDQMAGIRNLMSDPNTPDDVKLQKLAQFGEPGVKLATSLAGLQKQTADVNREKAFRTDLEGLGPNPTQDQLAQVAARHGTASDVLKTQQASLDRGAQREAMIEQKKAQIEAQIQMAREKGETAKAIMEMQLQGRKDLAAMAASLRQPPAPTIATIADPNDPTGAGTLVVDARSGNVIGKGPKLTQSGGNDLKLQQSYPQAKKQTELVTQNIDRLDTAISELEALPGLPNITGTIAGRNPNLTNEATTAQAKLNQIKAEIFTSSLQAMREASKTGGAVGNVSDKEGDKLERTLAALDQAQGTDAFKAELKKARAQLKTSKAIIQNAFNEQYGNAAPQPRGPVMPSKGVTIRFDSQGNPVQ